MIVGRPPVVAHRLAATRQERKIPRAPEPEV